MKRKEPKFAHHFPSTFDIHQWDSNQKFEKHLQLYRNTELNRNTQTNRNTQMNRQIVSVIDAPVAAKKKPVPKQRTFASEETYDTPL